MTTRRHPDPDRYFGCHAGPEHWRVVTYHGNYSAFNGYRFTPSDYSLVYCKACGARWRTKAAYVEDLAKEA